MTAENAASSRKKDFFDIVVSIISKPESGQGLRPEKSHRLLDGDGLSH